MLGVGVKSVRGRGPELEPELRAAAERVERGQSTCDAVAAAMHLPSERVAIALTRLELLGYLRADATGRYSRTTLIPPDDSTDSDGDG